MMAGVFCSAILASCTLYEKPDVPAVKTPDHFKVPLKPIKITDAGIKNNWWENFGDNQLNQLVNTGIKNNTSYLVALKNIDIAATYVSQNYSGLFPQVNAGYNLTRNSSNPALVGALGNSVSSRPDYNLQELTGTVSYEVDVWNQIRNSVKQAQANQSTSVADANIVKLALITSIVQTYYQIMTLDANINNLHQQYAVASQIVHIYSTQFHSGLIDASAVDNARNVMETANITIAQLQAQKQVLEYTLAYLTGDYPEDFNPEIKNNLNTFNTQKLIPANMSSTMIANRPDVQAAYFQILSFGYVEKQNIANFLPAISLTGTYGYASTALSGLVSAANSYWNFGVFATQFVFDYQTRMSEYNRSKYQYQSAILSYRDALLNSFNEVDSALITYKEDDESLRAYQAQVTNYQDLAKLSSSQFKAGLVDYSIYLTSELNALQSSYNLASHKQVIIQDVIQVYKTLGLGVNC